MNEHNLELFFTAFSWALTVAAAVFVIVVLVAVWKFDEPPGSGSSRTMKTRHSPKQEQHR